MEEMRLQKFISNSGYSSRRKAEEIIKEGRVRVNNQIVQALGTKVDITTDRVTIDGKIIKLNTNKIYIKLNKPNEYITTVKDQFNRPSVIDLIDIKKRIYPIGRLDYNTNGLLLLTNDGDIAFKLTHPKYNVYKTYLAKINGEINQKDIKKLESGVDIGDYITSNAKAKIIKINNKKSTVEISIHEGKNRQVRRMFESISYEVIKLKRISFGEINLGNLAIGKWSYLSQNEIDYIKKIGG